MSARVGIVVFPGTNCELDVAYALEALGAEPELVWHQDRRLSGIDAVVVPGGFAHGDFLRTGAIARFSPVMDAVSELAAAGAPVVGICNGFQVLTEAHLLPGALQKNVGLKFLCQTVEVRVETDRSALTSTAPVGAVLHLPINHFEGNYVCDAKTLDQLRAEFLRKAVMAGTDLVCRPLAAAGVAGEQLARLTLARDRRLWAVAGVLAATTAVIWGR